MYSDEELISLSALQHWLYCPRQCALIHVEQAWAENRFTAEGEALHERVHERDTESRIDLLIVRSLRLVARKLGLVGQADVVEFRRCESEGCRLPNRAGLWQPFPVEYKRGKAKLEPWDDVQLCGQALCLEEMLGAEVARGALYYGQPRKRKEVTFDEVLRAQVVKAVGDVRDLLTRGETPTVKYSARKCGSCSLVNQCLPQTMCRNKDMRRYLDSVLEGEISDP